MPVIKVVFYSNYSFHESYGAELHLAGGTGGLRTAKTRGDEFAKDVVSHHEIFHAIGMRLHAVNEQFEKDSVTGGIVLASQAHPAGTCGLGGGWGMVVSWVGVGLYEGPDQPGHVVVVEQSQELVLLLLLLLSQRCIALCSGAAALVGGAVAGIQNGVVVVRAIAERRRAGRIVLEGNLFNKQTNKQIIYLSLKIQKETIITFYRDE